MKTKAQAATVIHQQLQALQVLLSRTTKRLRTDGTKEQQVPQLINWLRNQRTQLTTTAPNSSAQNSLVERRFRTVFAAVRAALADSTLGKEYWTHAALDAIDKANHTPTRRADSFRSSIAQYFPDGPDPGHFHAFGQHGYIVNTNLELPKLADRA